MIGQQSPPQSPTVDGAEPKRILIVDGDPSIRQFASSILNLDGHRVQAAADGNAAWDLLLKDSYDLMVTDYIMPKVSGLALIRRIRIAQMALPIILASGSLNEMDAIGLNRDSWSRVDAFLNKPFIASELQAAVKNLLSSTNILFGSSRFCACLPD